MSSAVLDPFIADSIARVRAHPESPDCVAAIAPLMHGLPAHADSLLAPQHLRADPAHHARNAIQAHDES